MKSLVANGNFPPQSKGKRFGFGPEKRSASSPSIQHAKINIFFFPALLNRGLAYSRLHEINLR